MKMYDVVVGVGCSFMNGDAILDKDGKAFNETNRIRPGRYLSKLLNCDEVNIANTGSSNERIMREIYNWVESNTKYKNPLIMIGLSGLARYSFQNQNTKEFYDLQPGSVDTYTDKTLSKVNIKLTSGAGKTEELRTWLEYYIKHLFSEEFHSKKLQRELVMLHYYLKSNGCDYRIHNSLDDNLGDVKNKLNFISFIDNEYNGPDIWKEYLSWQMKNIDGTNFETGRNPTPPYGLRFCDGHPSPLACEELAQRIYKDLKL